MDDVAVFGLKIDSTQAKAAADQFERSLDRLSTAGKKAEGAQDSLNASMGRLKRGAVDVDKVLGRLGTTIGVALAGGITTVGFAFRSTVNRMDELSKAAQRAQMPTEDFSRLAYAADLADVSMKSLQGSMGRLAKAQGDAARGSKEQERAFGALGIAYRNADGSLRNTNDVFAEFADRFQEFQGSPEVVALGMALFGRSFQDLIPLLKDGSRGLRDAAAEADAFGLTISTRAGQQAEEFNDNLTRLTKAVEGLKIELLSGLIPQLDGVIRRFIAARREGLGFIEAIDVAAGLGGFSNLEEKIAETQRHLDRLRKGPGLFGPLVFGDVQKHIAEAESRLQSLLRIQRLIAGANPDTGSFGALVSEPPTPGALRIPRSGGKAARPEQAALTDEQRTLIAAVGLYRDVEERAKDYGLTLQWLDRLYFDNAISTSQYDAAVQQLTHSSEKMGADGVKVLDTLAAKWKDMIDPTREYTRQIEEIRGLVAAGKLSKDQGTAAELEVESRRNDDMLGGVADATKETSDAARALGLTFQSAFEDAIIEGESLRNVLSGIGQDLLRLTIRKSITEPAAEWLASSLNLGALFKPKSHADGLDYVPFDNYPALLHRGERVMTASENASGGRAVEVHQTLHIGQGVSRSEVAAALAVANAELKRQLYEDRRNGGVFA